MSTTTSRPGTTAGGEPAGSLVFLGEPGGCAGRLDPGQALIPGSLADRVDFHVWPSASPWAISPMARTVCEHIDYEYIHRAQPELFERRQQFGAPSLSNLWEAKRRLGELGYFLVLDMQLENWEGDLALVVYGAGVVGHLNDRAWTAVAALLTTDSTVLVEPAQDVAGLPLPIRPARPSTSRGKRKLPSPVTPLSWQVGDWAHTWWGYPLTGGPTSGVHTVPPEFGPGARAA